MKKLLVYLAVLGIISFSGLAYCEQYSTGVMKWGNNILIEEGTTVHDALAVGGNLMVNGKVEKDAVSVGGSVILGPKSAVGGNVVTVGGAIEKAEGAKVAGNLVEMPSAACMRGCRLGDILAGCGLFAFLGLLAVSLLVVSVAPRGIGSISAAIEFNTLRSLILGVIGMVLIAPVAFLLGVSIIGILLIPVEMIFVICALLVGYIAVSQVVGKKLTIAFKKPRQHIVTETFLGLLVLFIVSLVPILGWLVQAIAVTLALGGSIAVVWRSGR